MLNNPHDPDVVARRLAAVSDVRQVVRLIWLLARSQLPEAEEVADAAGHYVAWIADTVHALTGEMVPAASDDADALHIVFGPERGFCGGLARSVLSRIPSRGRIGLVGRQLVERASAMPELADRLAFSRPGALAPASHEAVAYDVAHAVIAHAGDDSVFVHHPMQADGTLLRQTMFVVSQGSGATLPETLSPRSVALEMGIHELIMGRLALAAVETLKCELRARIIAADRGRSGCDRRMAELQGDLAAAIQQNTTREILETVAGQVAR